MPQAVPWTAERVRALPADGKRYEVIGGELFVTPGPSWGHQEAAGVLYVRLRGYLAEHRLGFVILGPGDVEFDATNLVEPDAFVVPAVAGRRPHHWDEVKQLLLVIEVLSPSTARVDRTIRRRLYQERGVPEYWIVDLDARVIERWRSGDERPEIVTDVLRWSPPGGPAAFTLDLSTFFAEVLA
jgi:Uma2 family endonuclease